MSAPINKLPPEVLALIPDFWNKHEKDQNTIALTHVCRAWREVFVSRPSLWARFDCVNGEKTRIYFERSKASPIDLSLCGKMDIRLHDPLFHIIPHATGRLKFLYVKGVMQEDMQVITSHLSHPAPLLEHLSISCYSSPRDRYPALPSTLFNGDLSSLRKLRLETVRTELPWRNMVNLTSFTLSFTPPGAVSVGRLLDFFESAPYLEKIKLHFATPTTSAQNGRLVSLACLKRIHIDGDGPSSSSVLLEHLLIPVGAKLEIWVDLPGPLIRDHLPRSLDNLKNFSNFTAIKLPTNEYHPRVSFSGPNGQVDINLRSFRVDSTDLTLESLREFDTSKIKQLEIDNGNLPSGESVYQALLLMKDLRTLTLFKCDTPQVFIRALQPAMSSPEVMVCPKLEEVVLVLDLHEETPDITDFIKMAAARASRGEKLRTIRIVEGQGKADLDVSELRKHVWNVEYGPGVGL